MCKVSNTARPPAGSNSQGKGSDDGGASEPFAHIKAANRKVRLIDILRHYGFKIEKNHQRPNWSNNIRCPLPSHKGAKERTPSFGYNFISDHCHCMGCGFTGRAVEFIAAMEGVTRTEVAEKILAQYGEDVSSDDFQDYEDDISPILNEGSKFIQECVQKHKDNPKAMAYIDKLIWWLDFYLTQKAPTKSISAEELKHRINRVRELLDNEVLNSR